MNRKQLILLIVVAAVLGGISLSVSRKEKSSWTESSQRMGEKLFSSLNVNDVESIEIKQASGSLTLAKKSDVWVVPSRSDYPANFGSIHDFLIKLMDLKVTQPVKAGVAQLPRLELLPPDKGTNSGTLVELKDKSGKTLSSLLLGRKHTRDAGASSPFGGGPMPDGRYVMVGGDVKSVALVSETFTSIEPKVEEWLDKDFLKVEKLRSASVTALQATNSWKLTRETENAEWKLADAKPEEKIDTAKVSGVNYLLSSVTFTDVADASKKPEELGLDKPVLARLETFDGFTYQVKVGKPGPEGKVYIQIATTADLPKERVVGKDEKPEDKEKLDKEFKEKTQKIQEKLKKEQFHDKWSYQVDKWSVESLLKERREFMADKKDDAKKGQDAPPGGIELPNLNQ